MGEGAGPSPESLTFKDKITENALPLPLFIVILQYYIIMGITKTDLYSDLQNEIAQAARAFSHPARVAILQFILKTNACINSDLVQEVGLAQATISQHLKELKEIGVIQGTIEGTRMNYCIHPQRWAELKGLFTGIFEQYEVQDPKDCC